MNFFPAEAAWERFEDLVTYQNSHTNSIGLAVHVQNPRTLEAKSGGLLQVWGPFHEFQANIGYKVHIPVSRVYCLKVSDFVMLVYLVCNYITYLCRQMSSFLVKFTSYMILRGGKFHCIQDPIRTVYYEQKFLERQFICQDWSIN